MSDTQELIVKSTPDQSVPKPVAKKGRTRKYATPEEAHEAKLRHMREWRARKKAEKLAAEQAILEDVQKQATPEEAEEVVAKVAADASDASDSEASSPESEPESIPRSDAPEPEPVDKQEFKLVLKFASAKDRDQYIKKFRQK